MNLNLIHFIKKAQIQSAQLRRLEEKNNDLEIRVKKLERIINYLNNCILDKSQYSAALSSLYFERMGKRLNLANPQTYNEKIQWFKLYGITPEITCLADKYRVRDYVAKKIGEKYLVPLLGVWDSPGEIDFSNLPSRFVLKANHGSAYNYIVTDKKQINIEEVIRSAYEWLIEDYAFKSFEMQYLDIPRKLIAEEYLSFEQGNIYDYKVLCFNGKAYIIICQTHINGCLRSDFYDLDWNLLSIQRDDCPNTGVLLSRPNNLDELIEKAEVLAEGFPQVRVDFYILKDKLYFSEMTFTMASGMARWNPPETDLILGKLFTYPGMP